MTCSSFLVSRSMFVSCMLVGFATLEATQGQIVSQSPTDATRFWWHLYGKICPQLDSRLERERDLFRRTPDSETEKCCKGRSTRVSSSPFSPFW